MISTGAPPATSTATTAHPLRDRIPRPRNLSWEWAVIHRREAWGPSTASRRRTFETERGARQYAERLRAGHGELSPVTVIVIECRPVGEWRRADLEQANVMTAEQFDLLAPPVRPPADGARADDGVAS